MARGDRFSFAKFHNSSPEALTNKMVVFTENKSEIESDHISPNEEAYRIKKVPKLPIIAKELCLSF